MLVGVKLSQPIGEAAVGTVIHVEDTAAEALIAAGLGDYATGEDMNPADEPDGDENAEDVPAVVENSIRALTKKTDAAIKETAKKALEEINKNTKSVFTVPAQPKEKNCGYKSVAHFCHDAAKAQLGLTDFQKKMAYVSKSYNNETTLADGGYLVPVEFSQDVFQKAWGDDPVLSRLQRYPIKGNILKVRSLARYQGTTGGAKAYWVPEGTTITDSKIITEQVTLQLGKAAVIVNATSELIDDEPEAFQSIIDNDVGTELNFFINNSIFNGGDASAANLLSAPAVVTVPRQSAGHVTYLDVTKMRTATMVNNRKNLIWVYNPTIENELLQMSFQQDGVFPVYMPGGLANGASEAPVARLLGIPMVPLENMPTLGSTGDLFLFDPTAVGCAYKEINGAMSSHVYFLVDQMSFRWTFRVSTKPLWTQKWTRADGTFASPYVALSGATS